MRRLLQSSRGCRARVRFGLIATLAATSIAFGSQTCSAVVQRGERPEIIDKITVVGLKTLAPTAVEVMSGAAVGENATDEYLKSVRTRLVKSGLFGMHFPDEPEEWVRVRIEPDGLPAGHGELLIIVDENDKITGASVTGSGPIPTSEVLSKFNIGSVYNSVEMVRARRAIQDMYSERGYIMSFASDFGIDSARPGLLNVSIIVARVRDIRVSGNRNTRAFVIRRELQTTEGGYFNRKLLQSDIKRLGDLGLFTDLDPVVTPVDGRTVSIEMKVKEKKVRGYNFGSSVGGGAVAGYVEVSDQNFRGQGELLGLHAETGLNADRHLYEATFVEPFIDRHATSMSVNAFDTRSSVFSDSLAAGNASGPSGSYVQEKIGGSLRFQRPLQNGFSVAAGLKGETVRTDSSTLGGVNAFLVQDGPLVLANFEATHSSLDLRTDPASGSLQRLSFNVGHADLHTAVLESPVAGQHNYVKPTIELQQYYNLQQPRSLLHPEADRKTIAFRLQAGGSSGILPFSEQYFVGGATGLRGYKDGRFWGQNMAIGTIEYRHPITKGLKGVLFADAGDAWGGNYQDVSVTGFSQAGFKIHASTGAGIRVGTPMGQVRLDYGVGDEGGRIHFGIGTTFR